MPLNSRGFTKFLIFTFLSIVAVTIEGLYYTRHVSFNHLNSMARQSSRITVSSLFVGKIDFGSPRVS